MRFKLQIGGVCNSMLIACPENAFNSRYIKSLLSPIFFFILASICIDFDDFPQKTALVGFFNTFQQMARFSVLFILLQVPAPSLQYHKFFCNIICLKYNLLVSPIFTLVKNYFSIRFFLFEL